MPGPGLANPGRRQICADLIFGSASTVRLSSRPSPAGATRHINLDRTAVPPLGGYSHRRLKAVLQTFQITGTEALQELLRNDDALELWETREDGMPVSEEGKKVSEAEYWEKYYENPDFNYEWKNGCLEVSPVSDYESFLMFDWFQALLRHFLTANPMANTVGLEFGFRMEMPHDTVIRKSNLTVVCNDNPIALGLKDLSYGGIFDLCIEVISYSSKKEEERDTKEKKSEYCAGGIREYYILDGRGKETAFYSLGSRGKYEHIRPEKEGIIRSGVLKGFAFRESDLYCRPSAEEMAEDPICQSFVMPCYHREKQRAEKLEQALCSERERAERLAAKLRELGISDE